jgi:hypothetical protein
MSCTVSPLIGREKEQYVVVVPPRVRVIGLFRVCWQLCIDLLSGHIGTTVSRNHGHANSRLLGSHELATEI